MIRYIKFIIEDGGTTTSHLIAVDGILNINSAVDRTDTITTIYYRGGDQISIRHATPGAGVTTVVELLETALVESLNSSNVITQTTLKTLSVSAFTSERMEQPTKPV
jgi:hypothetical protein